METQKGMIHFYFVEAIFKYKPDTFCFGDTFEMSEDEFIMECWWFSSHIYTGFTTAQEVSRGELLDSHIVNICHRLGKKFWKLCNRSTDTVKTLPSKLEFNKLMLDTIQRSVY